MIGENVLNLLIHPIFHFLMAWILALIPWKGSIEVIQIFVDTKYEFCVKWTQKSTLHFSENYQWLKDIKKQGEAEKIRFYIIELRKPNTNTESHFRFNMKSSLPITFTSGVTFENISIHSKMASSLPTGWSANYKRRRSCSFLVWGT